VGLGLVRAGDPDDGERWSHGGFTGNFHSSAPYFPRHEVTVAVAVNDAGDISAIEQGLVDVLLDHAAVADPSAPRGFCNYDIYVARPDGTRRTRLTSDPGLDGSTVAWSPEGDRLAFSSTRTGNPEIFVMDSNGSSQENLTEHPANDGAASWSPDGRKIAFHSDRRGDNDIYVMDEDGSDVELLTSNPGDDITPAWSPDGSMIAFASGPTPQAHDIYVMRADGGAPRRVAGEDTDEWWPTWSPDGSRIAFVPDRRVVGGGGIEILRLRRFTSSALDVEVDGPSFPAWSSDGRLALVDFVGDLWTVRPDGSDLRRVTRTGEREFQPAWSPDGRWLGFPAERWVER
jgi:Tol biopolymer transport system component